MLTVVCVWVRANVPYGAEYVARLRASVARHLARPHRFVCLTDHPLQVPADVAAIWIPSPKPLPGWWAKLRLFDPAVGLGGRVLYLDLDSIIVQALDPIVEFPSAFALVPPGGAFRPANGQQTVRRYNSSVMVFDGGTLPHLWTQFTPAIAARLWGDQDAIGEWQPTADTMPAAWFPRISEIGAAGQIPAEARVILAKTPKPADAVARWPWVAAHWG